MKYKQPKKHFWHRSRIAAVSVLISAVLVAGFAIVPNATADQFDEQIRQLQTQNADKKSWLDQLAMEATSFQDVISRLNAQIGALQAQINANQAEQNRLQAEMEKAQAELDLQRRVLGADVKAMYVSGTPSTLEMLASSKDLSEFVDKEEYHGIVQAKMKTTIEKITQLQAELTEKKIGVERLLAEQQGQREQMDASRAESARLLTFNQQQQGEFNGQIQLNNQKISELRRQQVIANLALFGGGVQPGIPGGGGYPWGNAYCYWTNQVGGDCYNYDWYFSGSAWDPWGYGFRNCTSWVAYKLAADGKHGFSNLGNANQWPGGAQARGISVSYGNGARAGDAVINANGFYGHVMYVEAVTDDGRIVVSDYNRAGDGLYRGPDGGNANVLGQSGLYFIHF